MHNKFLQRALWAASLSSDPNTQVGAVIVGPEGETRSLGFNSFPRGVAETPQRLHDRDLKLKLMVHAEMNAILIAARRGMSTNDCTLYLAATDDTGLIWGGCPCTRCTVEVIQAGIKNIVSYDMKPPPSRWLADLTFARGLLKEAGIPVLEITP